jgi:hypothetical protein
MTLALPAVQASYRQQHESLAEREGQIQHNGHTLS